LHRSSGLPLFDRVLSLSQDGNVTLTDTCSK